MTLSITRRRRIGARGGQQKTVERAVEMTLELEEAVGREVSVLLTDDRDLVLGPLAGHVGSGTWTLTTNPCRGGPPPGPGDSATTSPKPTGVPVIASKQQPKTWEVVALPEATPKPPQQRTVTIAGAPPSSTDSDSTPRSAHPPAPSQATADAASKPAAANDSESVLREAQSAFMHGDRQTAIAAAMRVTARGGEEAIKAWRFVGAAACTGKVAALAANAYRNLHDPDHKRLLVELCQRNGLHFHDGNFSTEE